MTRLGSAPGTLLMVFLLCAGCGESPTITSSETGSTPAGSSGGTESIKSVSDAPDTRPLLPIMIQLEQDMNTISAGIWRENYEMIAKGARNIAHHPKIPQKQLKTIRGILGTDEFKTFVQDDKTVHRMSVELAAAAEQKNFEKITDLYLKLEQGCISCHMNHRGTIRSSERW